MQAIQTRYLGPTDTKPSRYKATAWAGSVTISADYSLDADKNHARAAEALARKLGWSGTYLGGTLASGDMVFINTEPHFAIGFEIEKATP